MVSNNHLGNHHHRPDRSHADLANVLVEEKPDPFRDMPFESGQVPQGEGRHRLVMQYYPLSPDVRRIRRSWNVPICLGHQFHRLPVNASAFVILFIVLLAAPLGYALKLALNKENW